MSDKQRPAQLNFAGDDIYFELRALNLVKGLRALANKLGMTAYIGIAKWFLYIIE